MWRDKLLAPLVALWRWNNKPRRRRELTLDERRFAAGHPPFCEECEHYQPTRYTIHTGDDVTRHYWGECRRTPPVASQDPNVTAVWPKVLAGSWCSCGKRLVGDGR